MTSMPLHVPAAAVCVIVALGPAAIHGITWHLSAPPIIDIEFEMDMRGVATRLWLNS